MPTLSEHSYLLGEPSESGNTIMYPQQLANAIAVMQVWLVNLSQTVNQTGDRLGRVETYLENCNDWEEERDRLVSYQGRDERDPDSQYLKSIKINVQTLDGRHDQQLFFIGLNNFTSNSCDTISLSSGKLSLLRWN